MAIIEEPRTTMTDRTAGAPPRGEVRVLHVINGEHFAGAERVQDELALRLPEFGYAVSFACVKPRSFAAMRAAQDAPLVEMPMRSRFDLRPVRRLARLIRNDGYGLVHTHTPRAALVGSLAAARAGVPMVHHVHGQTSTEIKRRWMSRLAGLVERLTVRRAKIIAVSASVARHLGNCGYSKHSIVIVPNGVPARRELSAPRVRARDEWTVGTLAMFRPRKGLETLLEAIAELRARGRNVRLRAVGGFEAPAYERQAKQFAIRLELDGAVDWPGFRRDVQAELNHMDLLVLPSLISEGMPMSLLEAMAGGVPVIGTRVDGIVDLIRDGVDGLLVKPGDSMDLAQAIEKVIACDGSSEKLRAEAYRRQAAEFSDFSMAAGVAAVYDLLLANARNGASVASSRRVGTSAAI